MARTFPAAFDARLRSLFPDYVGGRYNDLIGRYELTFLSAAGRPVSQFWGWTRNPFTGAPVEADPVTGLMPFRELDQAAQDEIVANCERTFLGNRHDGSKSVAEKHRKIREYNAALRQKKVKQRAQNFADVIHEVNLARPWLKYHQPSKRKQHFHAKAAPVSKPGRIEIVSPRIQKAAS